MGLIAGERKKQTKVTERRGNRVKGETETPVRIKFKHSKLKVKVISKMLSADVSEVMALFFSTCFFALQLACIQ